MADCRKKSHRFLWGTVIYAVVFLLLGGLGLRYLWSFLDAYERTRPQTTLAEYEQRLTDEYICDRAMWLWEELDGSLQPEEKYRQLVADAVSGGVSAVRKSRECTPDRMVYVLRSGTQVVGEMAMEAGQKDRYGLSPWTVTEEAFDFSWLLGEPEELTVPSEYTVTVNGKALDAGYQTGEKIPYPALEDYYEDYDIPYLVTYQVPSLLGQTEIQVLDREGNRVSRDGDWTDVYNNCPAEQRAVLDPFLERFIGRYVAFTGSNRDTSYDLYRELIRYVVPQSEFARRLQTALDGLQYGSSIYDEIVSLTVHSGTVLDENSWLCDLTYEVDTTGRKGVVRTTTNARLVVVQMEWGLRVLSMNVY